MIAVDLNCDVGEGAGCDEELMPLITSANIACGAHAGDLATMRETLRLAAAHGVAAGAHPGFRDRKNFGRLEQLVTPGEMVELVQRQIEDLHALAGPTLRHVKLHGALYNQVSPDAALSAALVEMLQRSWPGLALFALANSELWQAARRRNLRVASEVFADRTYQHDGSLTARARPDAMIQDEAAAVAQVLRMVRDGKVRATDGTEVPIVAETICLHGDGPHAVAFARRLRKELQAAGVQVRAAFDHEPLPQAMD